MQRHLNPCRAYPNDPQEQQTDPRQHPTFRRDADDQQPTGQDTLEEHHRTDHPKDTIAVLLFSHRSPHGIRIDKLYRRILNALDHPNQADQIPRYC